MTISNRIKKRFAIGVLFLLTNVVAYAQFDGQTTQYMFNIFGHNPAAIGEQQMIRVLGMQRLQWIGVKNAPSTTDFSANMPFRIKKTYHAAGILFSNDMFGIFTNQTVNALYAYKFKIGDGFLSLGTNLGFVNMTFKGDSVYIPEGSDYHSENDLEIPKTKESKVAFDMGLGVYYSCKGLEVGFSVLHLTEPTVQWGENTEFYLTRLYTLNAGYRFKLNNPKFHLQPSLMLKTDFVSWQLDVSLLAEYNERFWWGLAYRVQDAVSFLLGVKVLNGLMIGYSYDLPTSKIIRVSSGSHELFLSYEFKLNLDKKDSKYRSVRIL